MADSESSPTSMLDKEIGTAGLLKKILRRGVTWQTPFPGDQVEINYSGKIKEGVEIGSSQDEAGPFNFKLGQCEVIKGLDEGVCTMKKGERAILTIPPNLAYGELGFPPQIPPNSSLEFDVELLSWSSIRDLTGDGGVLKKIISEGEGWASPRDGDEAVVKYEVKTKNGSEASKSEDNSAFQIGDDAKLCPAIHKAVKAMRKGEKAELSVKFYYGMPFGLHVCIYLELMSWRTVADVTGDRKVVKKVLRNGEGFDHPTEGSVVKVIYTGRMEDGTVFQRKGSPEEPFEYTSLEEQISEGLDRAIMTMRKGEKAEITINHEFMNANGASKVISDDLNSGALLYEVELIDFTKETPYWKMETKEKIEACKKKKQDGNALFKAGKYWNASKKYEKALKYIEFYHSFSDEEKSEANALRASCYLNDAACKFKLKEYLEVSKLCSKVLELDSRNVKALFRRAQAYLETSDLENAEIDIKRGLVIEPNNRELKVELKMVKERQKEYANHQAKMFSNILENMG